MIWPWELMKSANGITHTQIIQVEEKHPSLCVICNRPIKRTAGRYLMENHRFAHIRCYQRNRN